MDRAKSNFRKYCIQVTAYAVANMLCTGAIVQTFLLLIGLTESQVYLYSSLTQFAQVALMTFMVFFSSKIKHGLVISAICNLLLLFPIGVFIIGAFYPAVVSEPFVVIIFLSCVVAFGGHGLYSVLSYCLPFKLINIADYGKFNGIAGAVSGIVTFGLSTLHTALISTFDYVGITVWFYVAAIVAVILSVWMFLSMKELQREREENSVGWSEILAVFRNLDTYYLLIPNFARGLALGVFNVMAVMAVGAGVANAAGASVLNLVIQAASFAASVIFTVYYKKLTVELMLLISTVGVCISLPFSLSFGFIPFLIIMLLALFFRFIVDSAIPTALVLIIPESQIGAYSSIRMLIFTAAQAIAAIMITPMVSAVGYIGVLVFAVIMQLICGVGHYVVVVNRKRKIDNM